MHLRCTCLLIVFCGTLIVSGRIAGLAVAQDRNRAPTVDESIRKWAQDAPLSLRFQGTTADQCRHWQTDFADKLRKSLGEFQPPRSWTQTVLRRIEHIDHTFEDLLLESEGKVLPLCILTPKGASEQKYSGILALHGHGPRGHLAIGEGDSGETLVRAGFVVVTPCFAPFGVRLGDPEAYGKQDPCGVTFVRMQLLGKLLIAENLRDSLWALEFLMKQPTVDADRVGCVGLSYGGRMTMLTAALEPRIRIAVVSGALNVMQERIEQRYSCGAQVIPGLLAFGDVPEIASLIAPRPAIWQIGSSDSLIKPDWATAAIERMRRSYQDLEGQRFAGHRSIRGWPPVELAACPTHVAAGVAAL